MDAALLGGGFAQRQRDVDGFGGQSGVEGGRFQDLTARGQRLGDRVLGQIDGGAFGLALLRRHLAERRQQRGNRPLLTERANAHRFERGFVAGGGDVDEDLSLQIFKIGHCGAPFSHLPLEGGSRSAKRTGWG
jgi:hypothetical protein